MITLFKRDLNPEVWEPEEYDSIDGFLGEGVYKQRGYLSFYSKVGWTRSDKFTFLKCTLADLAVRRAFALELPQPF
ncbi:hypothetical protein CKA32_000560 [Geitlerinema sp. FC II]|nr:hypothetical protein CKA32_000560 [Geitlerinema sp. FC II]